MINKKTFFWLLSAFFFFIAMLTAIPYVAERQLISNLHSFTKRTVLLEDVDFNPFTLELRLEKLNILKKESDLPFIAFDELYLNASWISLFQMGIIIDELSLKKPYVNAVMFSEKNFNFSDIVPQSDKTPPEAPEPNVKRTPVRFDKLPVSFNLKQLNIIDAAADFFDKPKNIKHQVKQFNFSIHHLSNFLDAPDKHAKININLKLNALCLNAHIQANIFQKTPKAKMILRCTKGDLSFYQPYISNIIDWELAKAILNANIGLSLEIKDNVPDVMAHGHVLVHDFLLKDNHKIPLVKFPKLEINFKSKPLQSTLNVSSVKITQPNIQVTRRNNQSLNCIPVLKKQPETKKKSALTTKSKKSLSPDIQIEKVIIENGHITLTDESLNKSFQTELQNIHLKLEQIDLTKQVIPEIDFQTNILPHGKIDLGGSLELKPLKWKGKIKIDDLDISMIQPYLDPFVNGHLETGRLFLQMESSILQKNNIPHTEISGTVALNHMAFREPVKRNERLVWEQLQIKKFNCGLFPHYIDIDEIRLRHLKAPLFLQTNGRLNWLSILKNHSTETLPSESQKLTRTTQQGDQLSQATTETSVSKASPFQRLIVRKIILEDSTIRFVDLTMTPVFHAHMSQLNGQVLGFNQEESKSMDFVLNGAFNDLSHLKIVGQLTPFQKPLSLKVDLRFDGIEVPVFTPYSSHYIGYPIDKGQLTLILDYNVFGNQLVSTNKVMINQLELGEKNEKATIPSLPIKFALALLKDREGKISIDIPVKGQLDSLNFSLKNVILQTIKNLMERMVTSPFSFLSALYGYGEDINYITFDYGQSDFNTHGLKKIEHISKMMNDRPLLKLQLFSHLNADEEQKALKRIRLKKELELLKFKEKASLSETQKNRHHSRLTSKEYDRYLIKLYASYFKKLPAQEFQNRASLEPTLLSTINIVSEDLNALALKRMVRIRNALVENYHISPDRIFIQEKKPKQLNDLIKSQVLLELH